MRKLATAPVCRSLTNAELDELYAITEEKTFPKGQVIFKEGDIADALLIIALGRIEISKKTHVLTTLTIGDVLGELSLLSFTHKRSASATALTEVTLLCIPSRTFRKLLDASNMAALKVVSNLAHQMSERMLEMTERLIEQSAKADASPAMKSFGRMAY